MPLLNLGPLFLKINCISIITVPIIMTFLQTHILADQCSNIHHHGAAGNFFKHDILPSMKPFMTLVTLLATQTCQKEHDTYLGLFSFQTISVI